MIQTAASDIKSNLLYILDLADKYYILPVTLYVHWGLNNLASNCICAKTRFVLFVNLITS